MADKPRPMSVDDLIARVNARASEGAIKYVSVLANAKEPPDEKAVDLLCVTQLGKPLKDCHVIMFVFATEEDRQKFRDEF